MAEPPKESVHSVLPQTPETTPVIPPRRSPPPSPILRPLPKPTGLPLIPSEPLTGLLSNSRSLPATPENFEDGTGRTGPRKETARLDLMPGLLPAAIVPPAPTVAATSNGLEAFDSIPRWFCWSLLGLSALIFLIQIWNYALS